MFRLSVMGLGLLALACSDAPTPSAGAAARPFLTEIVLHDGPAPDWPDGTGFAPEIMGPGVAIVWPDSSQERFEAPAIDAEAERVRGEGQPL